jgi:hypothetical protein
MLVCWSISCEIVSIVDDGDDGACHRVERWKVGWPLRPTGREWAGPHLAGFLGVEEDR